jgi:hypothetical protein
MFPVRSGMSRRLLAGAALLVAPLLLSNPGRADGGPPPKSLIYADWFGGPLPTPSFVRSNFAFLESRPFDGMVIYLQNSFATIDASREVMSNTPVSFETIDSMLSPLQGLKFSQLKKNFAYIVGTTPPDFFDDWSVPIQNFAHLAHALKDAGLKGVFFDNEQYFDLWAAYPGDHPEFTLEQHQDQARLRGRQVMEAMVAEFPKIAVLSLHGPYVSEPAAPAELGFPVIVDDNLLMGPFFAGFHEGRGIQALNVDGGELYSLRTTQEFDDSRAWRRIDFPSDAVHCAFLTPELRSEWTSSISLSFAVYDLPFGGRTMSPAELTPTLKLALDHSDDYAWFYTEGPTFLKPESEGGAPEAWVDAVRAVFLAPGPVTTSGEAEASGGGGGSGGCGLLGIEFLPLLGFFAFRRRAARQAA